jgi:hypothetical protein
MENERLKKLLDDQLLTSGKAARVRGVDRRTFQSWVDLGLIKPATTTPEGHRLYRQGDVIAVVAPKKGRPFMVDGEALDALLRRIEALEQALGRTNQ